MHYSIPSNILENTLIILGSPQDSRFKATYEYVETTITKEFNVKVRRANKVSDVVEAVKEFKPSFLIFDTHGNYDSKNRNSFLCIGDEILSGDLIEKHNITAPLVFLSACYTNPIYGYVNTIGEAFFGAGALSVTASFMPINIFTGTMLYNRVIANLSKAAIKPLHSTWLSFIAHNIRTSILSQAYRTFGTRIKLNRLQEKEISFLDSAKKWVFDSMEFNKRTTQYQTWIGYSSCQQKSNYVAQFPPNFEHDYLYYTILGRADLIKFESFEKDISKFRKEQYGVGSNNEYINKLISCSADKDSNNA